MLNIIVVDNRIMMIPSTMKAVVVESTGGIDVLSYRSQHPTPTYVPRGHALVRNEYAGLNFIDTYHRNGLYPRDCPFVLGQEGGGIVAGLYPGDEDDDDDDDEGGDHRPVGGDDDPVPSCAAADDVFRVGDRVAYGALVGSYAEYSLVPLDRLVRVPSYMEMPIAVSCMIQGLTAHYLSSSVGYGIAKTGDWVLVYGVGSGTGRWTAQMCKIRGYRVIGVTSRCKVAGGAEAAFGFCDELIVLENEPGKSYASYSSIDVVSRVSDVTSGVMCKLVIDGVGLSTYELSLNCLSVRGMLVSYGNASGPVPPFPVLRLLPRSAYVTRPKLNDYVASRDELLSRANEVFDWVNTGRLDVVVDRVFRLEEAAAGHEYLEDGRTRGKVLYRI
ncbi:hypothetical protein ACHAXA_006228 [Cyclostephanos tholiformis]|uniref:Enoyl reductase (ER) domain-containing protein n=1 Tax=Cyclostephanos tholiformis TaxID=382380 RepID=A0ABD3SE85_9STRA